MAAKERLPGRRPVERPGRRAGASRRGFLAGAAGLSLAPFAGYALGPDAGPGGAAVLPPGDGVAADDEAYWRAVRAQYWLPGGVVQLENGNWGVMSRPVLEAYERHTFRVNRDASYFSRREFGGELAGIRSRVAAALGVGEDEIAFARGATEVLQNLISGYRHLEPGDAVMYADADYDSMQSAMAWLRERRGVELKTIALPERASQEQLLEAYREALDAHPEVRLLLLTHLSHRHGLVLPVRRIVAMARERGVDCIVDAAHSWGQLDFRAAELGADFVGYNLHKWMGAPIGVGVMYIRRERLDAIEPYLGERAIPAGDIRARVHTGTSNYAALLAVPDALDFHRRIGGAGKAARLAYLRQYWVDRARDIPGVEILTLDDPGDHAGITSFRLRGMRSAKENIAIARRLLERHGVFTVHRTGLAGGACVRVTPGLFTTTGELDVLLRGLRDLAVT